MHDQRDWTAALFGFWALTPGPVLPGYFGSLFLCHVASYLALEMEKALRVKGRPSSGRISRPSNFTVSVHAKFSGRFLRLVAS